jgi:protein gp37
VSGKYWDKAWSLVDGCTKVSPGCDHCWLRDMDKRFHPKNLTSVKFRDDRLSIPLKVRKQTVFSVWSDLFHESVSDQSIARALAVITVAHQHRFLVLTKRPERALAWFNKTWTQYSNGAQLAIYGALSGFGSLPRPTGLGLTSEKVVEVRDRHLFQNWPLPNLYLGVTAENQEQADKRIPILLQIPAAHRFLSIEPMLGAVDLEHIQWPEKHKVDVLRGGYWEDREVFFKGFVNHSDMNTLDWVLCGGETGHGARPMHPDWVRSVRDQCQAAGVPFWFKQWGEWGPYVDEAKYTHCGEETTARAQGYINLDGTTGYCWIVDDDGTWSNWTAQNGQPQEGCHVINRFGSKKAGRLLDGREWNEVPW